MLFSAKEIYLKMARKKKFNKNEFDDSEDSYEDVEEWYENLKEEDEEDDIDDDDDYLIGPWA